MIGRILRLSPLMAACGCVALAAWLLAQGLSPSVVWNAGSGAAVPAIFLYAARLPSSAGGHEDIVLLLNEGDRKAGRSLQANIGGEMRDIPLSSLDYSLHAVAGAGEGVVYVGAYSFPVTGELLRDVRVRREGEDRISISAVTMAVRGVSCYSIDGDKPIPISYRSYGPAKPVLVIGGVIMLTIGAAIVLLPQVVRWLRGRPRGRAAS